MSEPRTLYFLTDGEELLDSLTMNDQELAEAEEQLGVDGAGECYWYITLEEAVRIPGYESSEIQQHLHGVVDEMCREISEHGGMTDAMWEKFVGVGEQILRSLTPADADEPFDA